MVESLSVLIRDGMASSVRGACADQALECAWRGEPALSGLGWSEISSLMHRRTVPAARQDRLLSAAIRCYRRGPTQVWGPVLLSMVGPAMVALAARTRSASLNVEADDLDQQVVVEALRACAEMPLPVGSRFVLRRIVLLVNKRITRWVAREGRHLAALNPIPELTEVHA